MKNWGYGIGSNDDKLINLYKRITYLQSQVMVLQDRVANIQIKQLSSKPYKLYSERLRNNERKRYVEKFDEFINSMSDNEFVELVKSADEIPFIHILKVVKEFKNRGNK